MTMKGKENVFNVRQTNYKNGISYKFDNRRVTVWKEEDNKWGFEFRSMNNVQNPRVSSKTIRGKVAVTAIRLSQEAAELVMLSLAEQMGYKVVK